MPGFSPKPVVIDGRGHLLGRLASTVAKFILNGNKVVIVRAEAINQSGNFYRNKLKLHKFLRLRCNVKPARDLSITVLPARSLNALYEEWFPTKQNVARLLRKDCRLLKVFLLHMTSKNEW